MIVEDQMKLERFYEDRVRVREGGRYGEGGSPEQDDRANVRDRAELTFVEKINIDGNTKTGTQTLLDLLSFKVGEPYHGGKFEASKARLRKLGGFSEVVMSTRKGSTNSSIVISIEVQE